MDYDTNYSCAKMRGGLIFFGEVVLAANTKLNKIILHPQGKCISLKIYIMSFKEKVIDGNQE